MISSKTITRAWAVPASGSASIADIVNDVNYIWFTYVSVRAAKNNAGDVSWKDSEGGEIGGYLQPGEHALLGDQYGAQMGSVVMNGTAGDVAYMTIGVSLGNPLVG